MPALADLAKLYADQTSNPVPVASGGVASGMALRQLPSSQNIDDRRGSLSLADLLYRVQHYFDPMGQRFPEYRTFPGRSDYGEDISSTVDQMKFDRRLNDMEDRARYKAIFSAYEQNPGAGSDLAAPIAVRLGRK